MPAEPLAGVGVLLVEDDERTRDVDRARAIDTGFDLYVTKPISPERLIEVVEDLRDIARAAQA